MVLKCTWKSQWPRRVKTLLKREVEGVALADSKNYSKGTAFKMVQYWQNDGQIDQWDRMENVEADKPCVEIPFVTKLALQPSGGRRCFFSISCWDNWSSRWQIKCDNIRCWQAWGTARQLRSCRWAWALVQSLVIPQPSGVGVSPWM